VPDADPEAVHSRKPFHAILILVAHLSRFFEPPGSNPVWTLFTLFTAYAAHSDNLCSNLIAHISELAIPVKN